MADSDIRRDSHPELTPDEDAADRGTNQLGTEDEHPPRDHATLPPVDPNYKPSDTARQIDQRMGDERPRPRPQTLFPYLFIRAVPGDRGARPVWPPTVCWESCDLHLLPAGVGAFDFGKTILKPLAGQTYRVFVHVWNLGRLAAYGGRVRVWWVEPGFFNGATGPHAQLNFIGGTYFDLGDRDSAESHRLIEIPAPWTVVMNTEAHECLLAAVESAGDPWDGVLDSNGHRHVAQRNLDLVAGAEDMAPIVRDLARRLTKNDVQVAISHASLARIGFVGAYERRLARSPESPAGWDHSGCSSGRTTRRSASCAGEGTVFGSSTPAAMRRCRWRRGPSGRSGRWGRSSRRRSGRPSVRLAARPARR